MADPGTGKTRYFTCDPRCVIPLGRFHVPSTLARLVRRGDFLIRMDSSFEAVVRACARDRDEENRSWISESIVEASLRLHALGLAHSVEAWRGGQLVGGLYGVALGGAFFGESMFCRPDQGGTNASKVCLVHLVERLRRGGFILLDSQYANEHILQFGAEEMVLALYLNRLRRALGVPAKWAPEG